MKSQTPAEGIMSLTKDKNLHVYRIACACSSSDCDVHMWIQVNEDDGDICVEFFVETTTPFWQQGFNRFKAAWDILIHGHRKDSHVLMLSKQEALNLGTSLIDSIEIIDDHLTTKSK
jgi:hypothetical protein